MAFKSFGVGLQQISLMDIRALEDDNTLHVTSLPGPVNPFAVFSFNDLGSETVLSEVISIDDDMVRRIDEIPGVSYAFPDAFFLVKVLTAARDFIILFSFFWPILAGIFINTLIISVIAGFIPAHRAARIEPIQTLRY